MKTINRKKLQTHLLPELFEQQWFEKQLTYWKKQIPENLDAKVDDFLEEEFEDDDIDFTKVVLDLCHQEKYFFAAQILRNHTPDRYCCVDECETDGVPLHWAVEQDEINLVMALLALEENVNEADYEKTIYPLTMAMMLNDISIFNLLLLHPEINVNVRAKEENDCADVCRFFGAEPHNYPTVVYRLLCPQYAVILPFIKLDLETEYEPEYKTLFAYACESVNINLMDKLQSLGANINPELYDDEYGSPNTLSRAICLYRNDQTPENFRRLQWYGKYFSLLQHKDSEGYGTLAEDIFSGDAETQQALKLNSIHKHQTLFNEIKALISIDNRNFDNRDIELSLYQDIARTQKVIFDDNVRDMRFSRRCHEIEFAVFYYDRQYPISFTLPIEALFEYGQCDTRLEYATPFQTLYWFLTAKPEVFSLMQEVASEHFCNVFKQIHQ